MVESLVKLSDGLHVSVEEWSKNGQTLIFLPGLTHTANCMKSLASHFLNDYRCLGITRRGFGNSSRGSIDYSQIRLVQDIQEVCTAVEVDSAICVGHSFGCLEIELLADKQPSLVSGCILLDGAYDHSKDVEFLKEFHLRPPPQPSETDLQSIEKMEAYTSRILGVSLPLEELAAIYTFDVDGKCLGRSEDPIAAPSIMAGVRVPNWQVISQPTLAVFAKPDSWEVYAPGVLDQCTEEQREFSRFFDAMTALKDKQIDNFSAAIPHAQIVRPECSNHYLHLSHEPLIVSLIRRFFRELKAGRQYDACQDN
jgi:pimeloyl-ACP methyl ester carboxylesterase